MERIIRAFGKACTRRPGANGGVRANSGALSSGTPVMREQSAARRGRKPARRAAPLSANCRRPRGITRERVCAADGRRRGEGGSERPAGDLRWRGADATTRHAGRRRRRRRRRTDRRWPCGARGVPRASVYRQRAACGRGDRQTELQGRALAIADRRTVLDLLRAPRLRSRRPPARPPASSRRTTSRAGLRADHATASRPPGPRLRSATRRTQRRAHPRSTRSRSCWHELPTRSGPGTSPS